MSALGFIVAAFIIHLVLSAIATGRSRVAQAAHSADAEEDENGCLAPRKDAGEETLPPGAMAASPLVGVVADSDDESRYESSRDDASDGWTSSSWDDR